VIREERRRTEAMQAMRLADTEAAALVMQARRLAFTERAWGLGDRQRRSKERSKTTSEGRKRPSKSSKTRCSNGRADAYPEGADSAMDREAKRAYNTRSTVLLLVVLAVVLMPIVAIIAGLSPQDFGSYIAPVTAIAGTVVGYWFGERGRTATGD
jgi:hypothetical protein